MDKASCKGLKPVLDILSLGDSSPRLRITARHPSPYDCFLRKGSKIQVLKNPRGIQDGGEGVPQVIKVRVRRLSRWYFLYRLEVNARIEDPANFAGKVWTGFASAGGARFSKLLLAVSMSYLVSL